MRKLGVSVTALALAMSAGAASADQSVSIVSTLPPGFQPAAVTVDQGETVTWTNNHDAAHTVRSTSAGFQSDTLNTGDTFSHTFTTPGNFSYDCSFHPTTMKGTVTVRAPAPPPSPSPSPSPSPPPVQSPSPSPRPSPSPTPSPSPSPSASPSPTSSPTVTGTVLADPDDDRDEPSRSLAKTIAWIAGIIAAISGAGLWYLRKTPA